jgi:GntR family transcriptional regulator
VFPTPRWLLLISTILTAIYNRFRVLVYYSSITLTLFVLTVTFFLKPNSSSGVPIYLQLKDQIRHAIETGALRSGDSLPAIRALAEELVVNANTVAKVYREMELEGLLDLRHGVGAFVAASGAAARHTFGRAAALSATQPSVRKFVQDLRHRGLTPDEIRRLIEAELEAHRPLTFRGRS